jgi:hypothetical protein
MKCSVCQCVGHNKRTCDQTPAVLPFQNVTNIRQCSACGECGHNKRTCPLFVATPKKSSSGRICSACGECGHNKRTCPLRTERVPETPKKSGSGRQCSACGECGHNARTCFLTIPEKKQKKCGVCDGLGHNARTCNMKCQPCSDQTVRSYCFAGFTADMAVKMTKVLECESIYGETEEYPQFVESPPAQRKTEQMTFANGESINLDLGVAPTPVE